MSIGERLTDIVRVFSDDRIPFALAGGFAFSIHTIPRATTGIDFVIFSGKTVDLIETSLRKIFNELIPHKNPIKAGRFLVWRYVGLNAEETVVDIMIRDDSLFKKIF